MHKQKWFLIPKAQGHPDSSDKYTRNKDLFHSVKHQAHGESETEGLPCIILGSHLTTYQSRALQNPIKSLKWPH